MIYLVVAAIDGHCLKLLDWISSNQKQFWLKLYKIKSHFKFKINSTQFRLMLVDSIIINLSHRRSFLSIRWHFVFFFCFSIFFSLVTCHQPFLSSSPFIVWLWISLRSSTVNLSTFFFFWFFCWFERIFCFLIYFRWIFLLLVYHFTYLFDSFFYVFVACCVRRVYF